MPDQKSAVSGVSNKQKERYKAKSGLLAKIKAVDGMAAKKGAIVRLEMRLERLEKNMRLQGLQMKRMANALYCKGYYAGAKAAKNRANEVVEPADDDAIEPQPLVVCASELAQMTHAYQIGA